MLFVCTQGLLRTEYEYEYKTHKIRNSPTLKNLEPTGN